ncbi:MAG: hypothetical protein A4E47_01666 [Methanosaeta sp. PtaU1.Bin028]|nr:MAG: hypothetical protein A4E47_01666 [Methanosaeta sp. PtaU1.Bin028]
MNHTPIEYLDLAAQALGFILLFGLGLSESLRYELGVATYYVIGWLPEILPFHIVLIILAAVCSLYTSIIQKNLVDWDFMHMQQVRMKQIQKDMREAQLSNDKAKLENLQAEQMKSISEQGKMMKMQFRPMLYIGIISMPIFMWIYFYLGEHPQFIIFPFWGTVNMSDAVVGPILFWFYWYFLCGIFISQLTRKILYIEPMI